MKLRLLIIPVAILLVVIATIGILLPQTFEIIGATKNAKEAKENLADTMAKIENADKLSYELTVNVEKQNILLRYIPKNKQEETIINNLDTIASSEGVAITSLAMVAEKKNADPGEASTKKKEEKASSNKLKTVEFSVNVVGSYDQIKSFLTKIKGMQRFNEIVSLKISRVENQEGVVSDRLQAVVNLGFGYMDESSISNVNSEVLKSGKFNMSIIDKISEIAKTDFSEVETGQAGKANPFMP